MAVRLASIAVLVSAVPALGLDKHDPLVVGQTFMAGSLDPTSGSTAWALTSHGISEKLFTVNEAGDIVGQVAESVANVDKFTWDVTLKDGYYFSDGTPVTPQLVADALTELNTVNSGAQASLGSMTVTPKDGLKLRIQSARATPVMDAVLAEWPFVVYLKKAGSWIFTGPFAVETFAAGDRINLVPNGRYPRASERPLVRIQKFADGQSLAAALGNSQVDMAFHLPVTELPALRQKSGVTIKTFEVGYHYMMWHNIRKAHMSDVRVRRALDIAIDRSELVQELRGGKATRSLFPQFSPYFSDTSQQHADKAGAEALLDAAGWAKAANGTRMKDGVALTVDLVAYPQRPGLVIMQPLIEKSLTSLGIVVTSVTTSGSSWDQLDQIMAAKDYDLLMWAQNTLPAGDPQWFLNAFFRSDAGSNHAGLNSPAVDALIDDLAHKSVHAERVTASAEAMKAILSEVPVSNLVTPPWHVGLSSRVSTYKPWGSDYYVIRADLGLDSGSPTPAPPTPAPPTPAPAGTSTGHNHETSGASRAILGALAVSWFPFLALML